MSELVCPDKGRGEVESLGQGTGIPGVTHAVETGNSRDGATSSSPMNVVPTKHWSIHTMAVVFTPSAIIAT